MSDWTQIGGDMNPADHGGIFAKMDGDSVELFEIQPVRACVGDAEAKEVGFPFWTKGGCFDPDDLRWSQTKDAAESWGMDREAYEGLPPSGKAEVALSYGLRVDEGPSGFGTDLPEYMRKAKCWHDGELGSDLDEADEEFRAETRAREDGR